MNDIVTNKFRVLIETNVFISAVIKPNSISRRCINYVMDYHRLLICSYTIDEVFRVVEKRFSEAQATWDRLLMDMNFELIYTPKTIDFPVPSIRDPKDEPIMASAILCQPDILISGDKDFHTEEIQEHFAIYTPGDFLRFFTRNE
jgi:putative PIN family toxin of toxin-antitoxin system